MKIGVFFDFHDIFVDARGAWMKAFRKLTRDRSVVEDYENGVSKRQICEKYNIDYRIAENIYRKNLKLIEENLKFAQLLSKCYDINLLSCSNVDRLNKDLKKFKLNELFKNVYSVNNQAERQTFLEQSSSRFDWVVFFNHENKQIIQNKNLIQVPIDLRGDFSKFKNISFVEHAKNKLLYNELSKYYMYAIGNDTIQEVDFINNIYEQFLNKKDGSVLDCCCGVGRHAYLLGNKGFKVTGIDISESQINNAKKIHKNKNVEYRVCDVRNIDLNKKDFDMAICMWTTYNYLSMEKDLWKFLNAVYMHLREDGLLVLDSKNIPKLDKRRVYTRETKDGDLDVSLLINKYVVGNIQNSQYLYFINNGKESSFYYDDEFVRFYHLKEIEKIAKGKFEVVKVYGDFNQETYKKKKSNRFIVVMKKI